MGGSKEPARPLETEDSFDPWAETSADGYEDPSPTSSSEAPTWTEEGPQTTFEPQGSPTTTTPSSSPTPTSTNPAEGPGANETPQRDQNHTITIPDYSARNPYDVTEEIPIGVQLCDYPDVSNRGVNVDFEEPEWDFSFEMEFDIEGFAYSSDVRNDCAGWLFRVWFYQSPSSRDLYYQRAGTGGLFNTTLEVRFNKVQAYLVELVATDGRNTERFEDLLFPPGPHTTRTWDGSVDAGAAGVMGTQSHDFDVDHGFHSEFKVQVTQQSLPADLDIFLISPGGVTVASRNATGVDREADIVYTGSALTETGEWTIEVRSKAAVAVDYRIRVLFQVPYTWR